MVLNLFQLTDSKAQLKKTNVNNRKLNNRGRHRRPRGHRGDREAMADRLLYTERK